MKKRGVSTVVATVLMIFIMVVAIGIFWVAFNAFISSSTSQIESLELVELTIDEDSIAYNSDDSFSLRVERNSQPGNVSGVRVIFEDFEGKVESYDVDVEIDELEIKTLNIPLQGLIGNISKVSIAPQTTVKGKVRTGNVADEYVIDKSIISDDNLLAYWDFEQVVNGKTFDVIDREEGELKFESFQSPGKIGNGITFDGDRDRIDVVDSPKWYMSFNDFSISAWGTIGDLSERNPIIDFQPNGAGHHVLDHDPSNGWRFRHRPAGGGSFTTIVQQGFVDTPQNTWHHISLVREGNNWYIYRNGERIATGSSSLEMLDGAWLAIGTEIDSDWNNYSWDGVLDEIKIYDDALTQQEVWYSYKYG